MVGWHSNTFKCPVQLANRRQSAPGQPGQQVPGALSVRFDRCTGSQPARCRLDEPSFLRPPRVKIGVDVHFGIIPASSQSRLNQQRLLFRSSQRRVVVKVRSHLVIKISRQYHILRIGLRIREAQRVILRRAQDVSKFQWDMDHCAVSQIVQFEHSLILRVEFEICYRGMPTRPRILRSDFSGTCSFIPLVLPFSSSKSALISGVPRLGRSACGGRGSGWGSAAWHQLAAAKPATRREAPRRGRVPSAPNPLARRYRWPG
jgi:hypothetical protein